MANTFIKIYIHVVFAVKCRDSAIPPHRERELHNYMAGIIRKHGHYPVEIGGIDNHVHLLISYENLDQKIPDLVKEIKGGSSYFANQQKFLKCRFSWQRGYACIGVSPTHLAPLRQYISTQHEHHNNVSLDDEVKRLLEKAGIEYDERYIIREE